MFDDSTNDEEVVMDENTMCLTGVFTAIVFSILMLIIML